VLCKNLPLKDTRKSEDRKGEKAWSQKLLVEWVANQSPNSKGDCHNAFWIALYKLQ
jgi:hypothetical protein